VAEVASQSQDGDNEKIVGNQGHGLIAEKNNSLQKSPECQ
jgi:hypothetical protein